MGGGRKLQYFLRKDNHPMKHKANCLEASFHTTHFCLLALGVDLGVLGRMAGFDLVKASE